MALHTLGTHVMSFMKESPEMVFLGSSFPHCKITLTLTLNLSLINLDLLVNSNAFTVFNFENQFQVN